jgi:holo-[acyl-carrier protein] synthase
MFDKIGIGIDVVEIKRFKKIPYKTNSRFYKKIFLTSEINYCTKFKNPYEHFAGIFAVKEAVKKSISTTIDFLDIETYHSNSSPKVRIRGRYKNDYIFLVSISHEKNIAVAVIISKKI